MYLVNFRLVCWVGGKRKEAVQLGDLFQGVN